MWGVCACAPLLNASADETTLATPNPLPAGYRVSYDAERFNDEFSVFQMTVTQPFGTLDSSVAASDDPRLHPLTRLDSTWTFGVPVLHVPARLGDTVSSTAFGDQPMRLGGLQIGTVQPALPPVYAPQVLYPSQPSLLAPNAPVWIASVPALLARPTLLSGTLLGTQRANLIAAGQSDFSLESGRLRQDFELRSNDYGAWLTSGSYRYGVNGGTTLDAQFAQLGAQQSLLGVGVLEGLGAAGLFSARLATSRDVDASGWLARMGYEYSRNNLSLAVRSYLQSPGYQGIGEMAALEPIRQQTFASAGLGLGAFGRVHIASAVQTMVDDTRRDVLAMSHAVELAGGATLSAAAAYAPGPNAGSAVLLSFSLPLRYGDAPARSASLPRDIDLDKSILDVFGQLHTVLPSHSGAGWGLQ